MDCTASDNKKTEAEIQAEAQAKTQVSKARKKREAQPVRRKERKTIKVNNSKNSETATVKALNFIK